MCVFVIPLMVHYQQHGQENHGYSAQHNDETRGVKFGRPLNNCKHNRNHTMKPSKRRRLVCLSQKRLLKGQGHYCEFNVYIFIFKHSCIYFYCHSSII